MPLICLVAALLGSGVSVRAEPPLARVETAGSAVEGGFLNRRLALWLRLDRPVPFRVFTLDDPRRLVVDFERLDASGFDTAALPLPATASALRLGRMRPGWTRLILDLARPMTLDTAEMVRGDTGAVLDIRLRRVGARAFAEAAGAPPGVWPSGAWPGGTAAHPRGSGRPMVVLDPGHGGIDPGALRDGIAEKDVVLAFAQDLRAALLATGRFEVLLTRAGDDFVALADRVALARSAGADAFLSLHTNAVADPNITGTITFTLSEAGSSRAATDRAAIENRADSVAGLDAMAPSDPVLRVLGDIRRIETSARSDQLARTLATALAPLVGATAQDPLQSANFQVLRAPDMPSVLLELGFLSNDADRVNMLSPAWRARASAALAAALEAWAEGGADLTRK